MNTKYKYLLIACAAIAVVDAIGAAASNQLHFNYAYIMPASVGIYVLLALFISKMGTVKNAAFYTALLGLFDATVGWKISIALGANTGRTNYNPTPAVWVVTVVFVMLYGALLGLLTASIYNFIKKQKLLAKAD